MSDWITDRRPAEDDADPDGNVIARHDGLLQNPCVHYKQVTVHCHWRHTPLWQPPLPTIKVGQKWHRADGVEVKVFIDDGSAVGPLRIGRTQEDAFWYKRDGKTAFVSDQSMRLVELIQDAPEEIQSPAAEFPEPIRTGALPFFVLVVSDDSGGKVDGTPIVWETQIPAGSSLQAVLQQRQRVGSRYGTTYVAECRIIPELTNEVTREVPF